MSASRKRRRTPPGPPEGGRHERTARRARAGPPENGRYVPARHAVRSRTLPLAFLLIVAAGLATYWNGLHGPFIWDDQIAIVTNPTIQHLWPLTDTLRPPRETPVAGRPLVNVSLALNYAWGGLEETGYHVINVAIHLLCALVLFGIVRRTMGTRPLSAVVVALLWLLHPLQSEAVDYITQRSESLMALFLFLTLYCASRARGGSADGGAQRVRPTYGGRIFSGPVNQWAVLAVLACACGMACKETMAVAPLVVVLYDWAFEFTSISDAFRERRSLYAGLAATWTVAAGLALTAPRSTVGVSPAVSRWAYLLNQIEMIGRYLRLTLWPGPLVLDYGLPRSLTLGDVAPQAMVIVFLLVATVVALMQWRRIGFLAAAFFLTLLPTSSVIPISSEVGAERRMYVPLAALAALVVAGGSLLVDWIEARVGGPDKVRPTGGPARTLGSIAIIGVLVAMSARTMARNAEYANPLTLWQTVVDRRPHGRARMALATELMAAGQDDKAIPVLRDAVGDFPDARAALGTALILRQENQEGVAVLRRFIAEGPSRANRIPAYAMIAQALASEHKLAEAAAAWRSVLALAPDDAGARGNLVRVLSAQAEAALSQRDADAAEPPAREAVALAPRDARARNLLGVAQASKGDLAGAADQFRVALEITPDDPQARANLERALRARPTAP